MVSRITTRDRGAEAGLAPRQKRDKAPDQPEQCRPEPDQQPALEGHLAQQALQLGLRGSNPASCAESAANSAKRHSCIPSSAPAEA